MIKARKQSPEAAAMRDKVATKIAGGILWTQKRWAQAMSRCFERLKPGARKAALFTGALLMMLYSGYLVASGFRPTARMIAGPASIKVPRTVQDADVPALKKGTPSFMMPVTRFHRYLDSLKGSGSGRRIRDSLLRERPGLLDSIKELEQLWCR